LCGVRGAPGGPRYHEIDRIFAAVGNHGESSSGVNEILTILAFVSHGLGVAFAAGSVLSTRPELRAIPLTDPVVTWTLAAIISRDGATPATHALLAVLPQPVASQWQPRHGNAHVPQPEPGGLNQRPLSAIRVAAS